MRSLSPILLAALAFGTYAMTRTSAHSGDDIQWMMRLEEAVRGVSIPHPASTEVEPAPGGTDWQSRYFLTLPTAGLLLAALHGAGWTGPAIVPVQLWHALLAALGVAVFFAAMRRIVPAWASALAAVGLSVSYAWWYYATHADYPMAAQASSCLFLYALIRTLEGRGHALAAGAALGAAAALAALYLESRAALLAVGAVAIAADAWLQPAGDSRRLRAHVAGYAAGVLGTFALGIAGGARVTHWVTAGPATPWRWQGALFSDSLEHAFAAIDVPKVAYGFAKSLAIYPGLHGEEPHDLLARAAPPERAMFAAWYAALLAAVAAPLVLAVRRWRALHAYRLPLIVLFAWCALEVPFLAYWQPTYVKWFGGALIAWWAVVAIVVAGALRDRPPDRAAFAAGAAVFVAALAATNLCAAFAPGARRDANPWLRAGGALAERTAPGDVFVSAAYRPLDFYLPYFYGRRVVSAEFASTAEAADEERTIARLQRVMGATADAGGRIFVYPCGTPPSPRVTALAGPPFGGLQPVPLDGIDVPQFSLCEIRPPTRQ